MRGVRSGNSGVEKGSTMHEDRQQEAATCADATAAGGDALLDQRRLASLRTGAWLWSEAAGTPFACLTGSEPTPASCLSEPTPG